MITLRITGTEPNILKVHHTKYLMVMGLGLADAKHLTDDVLDGKVREIAVPSELAYIHAQTLRLLGAKVETLPYSETVGENQSVSLVYDATSECLSVKPPMRHIISIGSLQPDKVLTISGIQVTLKYIPPGEYWIGSFEGEIGRRDDVMLKYFLPGEYWIGSFEMGIGRRDDEISHKVKITQGFYMMSTPVTQGLYQAVMGTNPSHFKGNLEHPVECVSWEGARAFASKISALMGGYWTLPTEAQWEWAARGGEEFIYAGSNNLKEVGWFRGNSGGATHPVKQKPPNSFGLYDMSGNIFEWTADGYGDYKTSGGTFKADSLEDPQGNERGDFRVLRGGSWDSGVFGARIANRLGVPPDSRYMCYGFRLVRSFP